MVKRTLALAATAMAIFAAAGTNFTRAAGSAGTWKGFVTDDLCAKNGLAQAGDAKCPKQCVAEKGSKYALYSPSDDKTYILNPQDKMEALAGKRVTIKGTLDGDVITVSNISLTAKK
jgi:hypothetical protein